MNPQMMRKVIIGAAGLLLVEYLIYLLTGMNLAFNRGGLVPIIVYKYRWLMAMTLVVGLTAPLSVLLEKKIPGGFNSLYWWAILVSLGMVGFTALTFVAASNNTPVLGMGGMAEEKSTNIVDYIQFAGSKIENSNPDLLKIDLEFKNRSPKDEFTEVDYVFVALEQGVILYRIKMRDAVYLPPGASGKTSLTWKKENFKDPKLFDRFVNAYKKNSLNVYAKATRAVRVDGTVIEEKTA